MDTAILRTKGRYAVVFLSAMAGGHSGFDEAGRGLSIAVFLSLLVVPATQKRLAMLYLDFGQLGGFPRSIIYSDCPRGYHLPSLALTSTSRFLSLRYSWIQQTKHSTHRQSLAKRTPGRQDPDMRHDDSYCRRHLVPHNMISPAAAT